MFTHWTRFVLIYYCMTGTPGNKIFSRSVGPRNQKVLEKKRFCSQEWGLLVSHPLQVWPLMLFVFEKECSHGILLVSIDSRLSALLAANAELLTQLRTSPLTNLAVTRNKQLQRVSIFDSVSPQTQAAVLSTAVELKILIVDRLDFKRRR